MVAVGVGVAVVVAVAVAVVVGVGVGVAVGVAVVVGVGVAVGVGVVVVVGVGVGVVVRKRVDDTILPTVEKLEAFLQCGPVTVTEMRLHWRNVNALYLRAYLIRRVAAGKLIEVMNDHGNVKLYGLPQGHVNGLIELYAPTLPTEYTSSIVDGSDLPEPPRSVRKESGPQQHSVLASVFMGG